MKLLIFTSKETNSILKIKGIYHPDSTGGWVDSIVDGFLYTGEVDICICYPKKSSVLQQGSKEQLSFYEVPAIKDHQHNSVEFENRIAEILDDARPDIILIFGTEHTYQCEVARLCKKFGHDSKTIIWIQGLVSNYYNHYQASLPNYIMNRYSIKDLIKRKNLSSEKRSFYYRGIDEINAICNVGHVIGRTDWDMACVWTMGSEAQYHFCNETLKECFYSDKWSYENCNKHTVFISQSTYPIKGFHIALQAIAKLKRKYPNIKLLTTGRKLINCNFREKLKFSAYENYLVSIIKENHLENNVEWLGALSGEQMKQQYLKANVYVSASSIENSPNSMGEAMLLGVPCVVSDVGGVRNLLCDKREGFIYSYDDSDLLAYYIHTLFENKDLACRFGSEARKHAMRTHSREDNMKRLNEIFIDILEKRG